MAKEDSGTYATYTGVGVNDNDLLFTTDDVSKFNAFELLGSAGVVDVEVQLITAGGWTTAAVGMQDLGAVDLVPVLVTAANRLYGFCGNFRALRVRQNGATAANYILRCFNF